MTRGCREKGLSRVGHAQGKTPIKQQGERCVTLKKTRHKDEAWDLLDDIEGHEAVCVCVQRRPNDLHRLLAGWVAQLLRAQKRKD